MLAVGDRVAASASESLASGEAFDLRARVLTGLALEMESSFRALLVDAASGRAEAMHHLKTLVEAYLYFGLASDDTTDGVAKRFLADRSRSCS
jgi:hypothetical protein